MKYEIFLLLKKNCKMKENLINNFDYDISTS